MPPQKLYIKTHGCQMNEYDTQKMRDVLRASHGMIETNSPEEADVILFNTCSVREKAQEKVFSELGMIRELKEKKPSLLIGVGGCVASQEGEHIAKRAPYVDVVFGPQTLHRLPALLEQAIQTHKTAVEISRPFNSVITEIATLANQGVREINLLGQNVNDYRGLMDNGKIADLALLIHYVAAIDGIARIR